MPLETAHAHGWLRCEARALAVLSCSATGRDVERAWGSSRKGQGCEGCEQGGLEAQPGLVLHGLLSLGQVWAGSRQQLARETWHLLFRLGNHRSKILNP